MSKKDEMRGTRDGGGRWKEGSEGNEGIGGCLIIIIIIVIVGLNGLRNFQENFHHEDLVFGAKNSLGTRKFVL